MATIDCDVVVVEHWQDLPNSLGPCPWTADELLDLLRPRGFAHFAFVVHHGEFSSLLWDDASIDDGEVGNLIFVHDRCVDRLLPTFLECASNLARATAAFASSRASAAAERLSTLQTLGAEVEALARERDIQAAAAAERLEALEAVAAERDLQAGVAAERLEQLVALEREAGLRLRALEELSAQRHFSS
jgi:hypothetical protein